MSLEKYLTSVHSNEARYAVVDSTTNKIVHTFQTDIVARAYADSIQNGKVVWCSKRRIIDAIKGADA